MIKMLRFTQGFWIYRSEWILIFPLYFTSRVPDKVLKTLQIVPIVISLLKHWDRPTIRGNNKFFTMGQGPFGLWKKTRNGAEVVTVAVYIPHLILTNWCVITAVGKN